jgi:glucan 1,3-beta-glucosidase
LGTGITINRAQVGFDIISGGLSNDNQTVGGISLIDAIFKDTPIAIRSSVNSNGSLRGSLVLNNVRFTNVTTAVGVLDGTTVLAGTTVAAPVKAITSWGQGNVYTGSSNTGKFVQGTIAAGTKHVSLVDVNGRIVSKGHPQYENYDVSQFASARDAGAKGDGVTDDTAALQTLLDKSKGCKIVFLDAGVYYVTSTRE